MSTWSARPCHSPFFAASRSPVPLQHLKDGATSLENVTDMTRTPLRMGGDVPFSQFGNPLNFQKVKVDERNTKGETARALAMMYGYTKIVSLIDSRSPRIKPGTGLNGSASKIPVFTRSFIAF